MLQTGQYARFKNPNADELTPAGRSITMKILEVDAPRATVVSPCTNATEPRELCRLIVDAIALTSSTRTTSTAQICNPLPGDYLALANAQGEPTENHAEIFMTQATVTEGVYLVETMQGEMYTATRYPELDTNQRRAWKQVLL